MENTDLRLAVLIDAENVPPAKVKAMLEEIAKYGTPTFKRIYGDWTQPRVAGWKSTLLPHAITPIQQYSYTSGKNSTDSAMIIDAMDILYSGKVDGFCIVSSDSDFTRLATRLREAGMRVFGMGEKKTPVSFIAACDKFIYIEILENDEPVTKRTITVSRKKSAVVTTPPEPVAQERPKPMSTVTPGLVRLIADSINDIANEDGWVFLGVLGGLILKKQPDFDPRNYGFKKLSLLIKSMPQFETQERVSGKDNEQQSVYVRVKPSATRSRR
ncbi:NYN domain-containing protein [Chitinophaga sp. XS-30]|uniref:NYN domain-containing protein n=1 Tax=Chitinophaga sp. XS-30 TaxID=2604421 RepID=UPI0011DCF285|nr:NYN domain-containing protein [Chitinophaga sp. XS-30]QEH43000.1 NYN domain-containing protein [Chitinophaga sp. XS-30]